MKFFPLLFSALAVFLSCKQNTPAAPQVESVTTSDTQLPADFNAFYEKFHKDSVYQMAHISWPLQGDTAEQVDSTHYQKKNIYWEQASWIMHRTVDYSSGDYKRQVQALGDGIVIEFITITAGGYGIERRFAKQPDGEWNMIFYSDMQERGK
ncbi:MAG TPA: hypothetical protein PLO67_05170 [Saprospiraceae bacterium]|nr:hypothetical protein [Saprospiraceae bacterium]HPI07320.1 hypothetical protein [Saprospiraceae bacterium]